MTEHTPTTAQELAPADLEHVAAGAAHIGGVNVCMGDGSVRTVRRDAGATDLAHWQSNYGAGG